jgi:hypothetical protein
MKEEQQLTEADEVILDMVMQHSDVTEKKTVWEIYHCHLSANERACAYLAQRGIFKEKRRGVRYTLPKKIKF